MNTRRFGRGKRETCPTGEKIGVEVPVRHERTVPSQVSVLLKKIVAITDPFV